MTIEATRIWRELDWDPKVHFIQWVAQEAGKSLTETEACAVMDFIQDVIGKALPIDQDAVKALTTIIVTDSVLLRFLTVREIERQIVDGNHVEGPVYQKLMEAHTLLAPIYAIVP